MGYDLILGTARNGDPVYGYQESFSLLPLFSAIPEMHGEITYAEIVYITERKKHKGRYLKKKHYPKNVVTPELF